MGEACSEDFLSLVFISKGWPQVVLFLSLHPQSSCQIIKRKGTYYLEFLSLLAPSVTSMAIYVLLHSSAKYLDESNFSETSVVKRQQFNYSLPFLI